MSNHKGRDRLLSCAVLCGLLFFTYGQEMEPVRESNWAEKISAAAKEVEVITGVMEAAWRKAELPEEEDAEEALRALIKDAGFRECVSDQITIEGDSQEEILRGMEECDTLVLKEQSCGIYSLEALSLFPNLRQLTIHVNERDDTAIKDFAPISQLSRLEYLWISYGKDEEIDLSFLNQMPTVTELFLTHCRIADVSFLRRMPQLQCLSLYQTPVEDLVVLENLSNLIELALYDNEDAKNKETVGKLTKMQDLGMQNCGIEDIGFLSGLTELRGVNLNGNRVTDITPLAKLDKLERVGLVGNRVRDISALGGLHNLFDLALDKNEIQDISVLAQLPHLNQVGISDNQIEDLSPLAGKEELLYVSVFGNSVKSLEPVWEAPLLWYTYGCAGDEGEAVIADWLVEHYPEAAEFTCIDFVEGDLNGDGLQDRAFVADSEAFDVYEGEDFPERMPDERRLFILLQRSDGSWEEMEETPSLSPAMSGGMRGDPYRGIFMQEGYLLVMEGGGSSTGSTWMDTYEYRNGSLTLVRRMEVDDSNFAYGYDVEVRNERDGTWLRYAIAMDGYRMVRVDLADSEHPTHEAFPRLGIYDESYYIYDTKIESRLTSSEALDMVCEMVAEKGYAGVKESLPYAKWQKEGYERLKGVTLPDYYYILPDTGREDGTLTKSEWEGGCLCYEGLIGKEGSLFHKVRLSGGGGNVFWLNDATGDIMEEPH